MYAGSRRDLPRSFDGSPAPNSVVPDGPYQHDAGMERTKREQTAEGKPSLKRNCEGAERLENASSGE